MGELIVFLILFFGGWAIGAFVESLHYKSLGRREKELSHIKVFNLKKIPWEEERILKGKMVSGVVVIGQDFFKHVISSFKKIIGGRLGSYETLIERARREAILRLKEQCGSENVLMNLRMETSTVGFAAGKKGTACIEVLAWATAIQVEEEKES